MLERLVRKGQWKISAGRLVNRRLFLAGMKCGSTSTLMTTGRQRTLHFQLELSVGAETKHFRLFVSEPNQRKPVHSFEYEGQQLSKESKELFSPSMDFTLDDVFNFWTCESRTTYMWKYILDSLLSASASKAFRTWDAIIVTDGEDNDSPEPFSGPSGFNAMMNSLHASGIRPRISVYCIGSKHCTGDANGMHFYRDLVLMEVSSWQTWPDQMISVRLIPLLSR